MNKIIIDTNNFDLIIKENNNYSIEILKSTNLNIETDSNIFSKITILSQDLDLNIKINKNKNSKLSINQLGINTNNNIKLYLNKNSNIEYVNSILTEKDSINIIDICHLKSDSLSKIIFNGINSNNKKFYLTMNGIILKESINCQLEENSRIINLTNGDSKIIPNLIINNKEVIANHSAFIGKFNDEDIYYLQSRGLTNNQAKHLLLKSTLLNGMNLEFDKDKFINVLLNYLRR